MSDKKLLTIMDYENPVYNAQLVDERRRKIRKYSDDQLKELLRKNIDGWIRRQLNIDAITETIQERKDRKDG